MTRFDERRTETMTLQEQIERLRQEAGQAGDSAQVAICDRALAGSARATAICARIIRDAHAEARYQQREQ